MDELVSDKNLTSYIPLKNLTWKFWNYNPQMKTPNHKNLTVGLHIGCFSHYLLHQFCLSLKIAAATRLVKVEPI